MKKGTLILFLLCAFTGSLFAQDNNCFQLFVVDSISGIPLKGATVKILETGEAFTSDKSGIVKIGVTVFPVNCVVSNIGFSADTIFFKNFTQNNTIFLKPTISNLLPVEIHAPKPAKLIEDLPIYISDYEIRGDSIFFIAYCNKKLDDAFLMVSNLSGDTLLSWKIKNPEKLYKDCFGNIHLICKNEATQIFIDNSGIQFLYHIEKEEFESAFAPIEAYYNNRFYVKKYSYNDQVLDYYSYDTNEKKLNPFLEISDEQNKFMMRDLARIASSSGFTEADMRFEKLCFYKPVCAPLFVANDSVVLFNFVDSTVSVFAENAALLNSEQFDQQLFRNFKGTIYHDPVTNRYYAFAVASGMCKLKQIDILSGKIIKTITIPDLPYISKISVWNDKAYFLYTERSNQELRKIYCLAL
jgi:hypothetical protein